MNPTLQYDIRAPGGVREVVRFEDPTSFAHVRLSHRAEELVAAGRAQLPDITREPYPHAS